MRETTTTAPLYVRLDTETDTAMRQAVRASPHRWDSLSSFVHTAIKNQLKKERKRNGS